MQGIELLDRLDRLDTSPPTSRPCLMVIHCAIESSYSVMNSPSENSCELYIRSRKALTLFRHSTYECVPAVAPASSPWKPIMLVIWFLLSLCGALFQQLSRCQRSLERSTTR